MDRLPRLGKRELICLLLFTCNYVVSVLRGLLFLWVLGMGYVIVLWHSLPLIILHPLWCYFVRLVKLWGGIFWHRGREGGSEGREVGDKGAGSGDSGGGKRESSTTLSTPT